MKPIIKCVLVGDNSADKTSLLNAFVSTSEHFSGKVPDNKEWVFDHFHVLININSKTYGLSLYDTPEEFDKLRPLSYPYTDVFLVCFSLVDRKSFKHVREKYATELNYHLPFTPVVLVGTQLDRRQDRKMLEQLTRLGEEPVSKDEGQELAKEMRALYLECSAASLVGINAVFSEASRIAIQENPKLGNGKDKKCALM